MATILAVDLTYVIIDHCPKPQSYILVARPMAKTEHVFNDTQLPY